MFRALTINQIKAARALLDWTQQDLAQASGLALSSIRRYESVGMDKASLQSMDKIVAALEGGGVQFIPENGGGIGVRLKKPK